MFNNKRYRHSTRAKYQTFERNIVTVTKCLEIIKIIFTNKNNFNKLKGFDFSDSKVVGGIVFDVRMGVSGVREKILTHWF